ncbi:MAG: hypothetical protein HGA44_15190 [Cellulomonadaceae bacterium]|nr:hypothetical protein [Cellulomonadaceae bacterium]
MNDFGTRYVVDTNALSQLGQSRRASPFFRESARIPDEVLHEAQGFPDIAMLQQNAYPTTAAVLSWLRKVMATVPADDTALVNLYANQGNADPLLVACALDGQSNDSQYLFPPEWIVVTADQAVRAKAEEFDLKVLTNAELATLIDAAENEGPGRLASAADGS